MRLNDVQIIERLTGDGGKTPIVVTPMICAFEQIGPSSIDVHLGTEFMVVAHSDRQSYDPLMTEVEYQKWLKHLKLVNRYSTFSEPFVLHPWQFTLASTLEFISLPDDIVGRIDGRSSWARQGLVVHSTAGDIHPGSRGFVVFELMNYGPVPILLYPGLAIAQLTFEELSRPARQGYSKRVGSKYSGFKSSLWSGYQDDSVLSAMRRLKSQLEQFELDKDIARGEARLPSAKNDQSVKHGFMGGAAAQQDQNWRTEPRLGIPAKVKGAAADFREAISFFKKNHSEIAKHHAGQYVAILDGKIIDHDKNWEQLSERIYRTFGAKDLYIPFVDAERQDQKVVIRPRRKTND
jgi:dCTP deaminase